MSGRTIFLTGLVVLVVTGRPHAETGSGGQAGAFLRDGAGGRAAAMAGAFAAQADDPSAAYYNPAGLGRLRDPQVLGTFARLPMDRAFEAAAISWPFGNLGALSANWVQLDGGGLDGTDRSGVRTGTLSDVQDAALLSAGVALSPYLAIGGSARLLRHRLAGYQASGAGCDLGLLLVPCPFVRLGAGIQNLRARVTWNTPGRPRDPLPRTARMGICLGPLSSLHLNLDYERIRWQGDVWHIGGEATFSGILSLRGGVNGRIWAAGASVRIPFPRHSAEIDYGISVEPFTSRPSQRLTVLLTLTRPANIHRPQK